MQEYLASACNLRDEVHSMVVQHSTRLNRMSRPGAALACAAGAAACVAWAAGLPLPSASRRAPRTVSVDMMTSADRWQLGGTRVAGSLGRSTLFATRRDPPAGRSASLDLVADFSTPERTWVWAACSAPPIPGRCRSISLEAWSDGNTAPLRIVIVDRNGAWFERVAARLAGEGWRTVIAPLGGGADWQPVLRRDETAHAMQFPIAVRGLVVGNLAGRIAGTPTFRFADLRAETEVTDLDLVDARIETGRTGNVFASGETPQISVRLANRAGQPVQGACEAVVTPWGRSPIKHPLGQVVLPAGGARLLRFKQPASVYGPYDVLVTFGQREAVRKWRGSFAYMRTSDVPGRSSGPLSRFGACGNVGGFDALLKPATERLNRMGGFGWTRIGLAWAQVNPAPGVWAWDPPTPTAGPVGTAARIGGRTYRAPHNSVLNCPDEVTIACWARLDGPTGARQIALRKWGPGVARNYGAFFDRETGAFTFSAGYERGPGAAPASRRQAVVEFNAGPNTWDRQWRHYAATYSRHIRSVCLYVDGVLRTSAIHDGGRLRTNDADLLIGQDLAGDLDEVLVYRRALGPADIAALARKSSPPKDGLLAWYSFDVPGGIGRNRAVVAVTAAGRVAAGSPRAPFGGSANVTPPLAAANVAPKSRRQLDLVPVEPDGARLALEAHAQGMRTLAILGFPPAWASSRPDAPRFWVHEPDLKAWSAYVEAVTRQYRDRISCWEIWNEPNSAEFWEPAPDPARYLTVLKVAYAAAKRGNPRCKVVMPGLGGLPADGRANRNRLLPLAPDRDYMDRLLSLGAARYCDAISVHPYPSGTPEETDLAGDLRWIAAKCAATGVKRPIWITEIGWPTQVPVAGGTPALLGQGGVSERMQSALLARTAIVAVGSGLVERMFWFRLHDSGPDRMSADDSFGLCREDLSPKPAFFAHRTVAVLLGDARPTGEIALGRHVIAKVFQSPNERFAALWRPLGSEGRGAGVPPATGHRNTSETVALIVRRPTVTVTDLMGNSRIAPTQHGVLLIGADETPVFIRGLGSGATGMADLIVANPPTASPPTNGAWVTARVRVRNPYPVPLSVALKIEATAGLQVEPTAPTLAIPARGAATVEVRTRLIRPNAKAEGRLTVRVRYPGGTVTATIPTAPAREKAARTTRTHRSATDA